MLDDWGLPDLSKPSRMRRWPMKLDIRFQVTYYWRRQKRRWISEGKVKERRVDMQVRNVASWSAGRSVTWSARLGVIFMSVTILNGLSQSGWSCIHARHSNVKLFFLCRALPSIAYSRRQFIIEGSLYSNHRRQRVFYKRRTWPGVVCIYRSRGF